VGGKRGIRRIRRMRKMRVYEYRKIDIGILIE
jgi:hypothetical protein